MDSDHFSAVLSINAEIEILGHTERIHEQEFSIFSLQSGV